MPRTQDAAPATTQPPHSPAVQSTHTAAVTWQHVIPVPPSVRDRPLGGLQTEQARGIVDELGKHSVQITQYGHAGIMLRAQHEPPADLWRTVRTEGELLFRYLHHAQAHDDQPRHDQALMSMLLELMAPEEELTMTVLVARARARGHHTSDHAISMALARLASIGRISKREERRPGHLGFLYRRVIL